MGWDSRVLENPGRPVRVPLAPGSRAGRAGMKGLRGVTAADNRGLCCRTLGERRTVPRAGDRVSGAQLSLTRSCRSNLCAGLIPPGTHVGAALGLSQDGTGPTTGRPPRRSRLPGPRGPACTPAPACFPSRPTRCGSHRGRPRLATEAGPGSPWGVAPEGRGETEGKARDLGHRLCSHNCASPTKRGPCDSVTRVRQAVPEGQDRRPPGPQAG